MTEHKPITAAELDAIEARATAATPAPWGYQPVQGAARLKLIFSTMNATRAGGLTPRDSDVVFIAHARTDLPRLVAELKRLRLLIAAQAEDEGFDGVDVHFCRSCARAAAKALLEAAGEG